LSSLALLGLVAGCGGPSNEPGIAEVFPDQFRELNAGSRGFRARDGSYVLVPERTSWLPNALEVALPTRAALPIEMRADGAAVQVREDGVEGTAELVGNLVTYRRGDGRSYWAARPHGIEEWLFLPDGVADAKAPAASWVVSGAEIRQSGPVVIVYDASGRPRIQVSADRAFGPNGEPLSVQLHTSGDRIDLHVQASAGPVLIDPLWIDLATMVSPRHAHAATLLLDGTVLASGGVDNVAIPTGGSGGFGVLTSAEIYDPLAVLWNGVSSMFYERAYHTLTTLDDGRALAHGGRDNWGFPSSCPELWDPTLPAWVTPSSGGCSFCYTSGGHTATKLADGSVLLAGGEGSGGEVDVVFGLSGGYGATTCTERFLPGIDNYNYADDMDFDRRDHSAVRLADDRVLVSGGVDSGGFGLDSSEIYDPINDLWSTFAPMTVDRNEHTLTRLCDNRVLAAGGQANAQPALDSAEIYDVAADTWTPTPTMQQRRVGHTANLLANCKVLVVGGYDGTGYAVDSAELYDPVTNTWTFTESITGIRGEATGTSLNNQAVLVAGGFDGNFNVLDTSMVYQPLLAEGEGCATGADCLSGNCVDDVCCDQPCAGPCEACRGQGNDGFCAPVLAGLDPDNECANEGAASCGQNGACDGGGACELFASGTECTPVGCQGHDLLNPDTCNGGGTCVDAGVTDCDLYSCAGGACLTSCAGHPDCDNAVAYCDTGGQCVPKKNLGEPATSPEECISGFVADGVCCDTACDGMGGVVCDACTVANGGQTDGVCAVLMDCDDGEECTADACDSAGPMPVCGYVSKLDGSSCTDGICIAGDCVPDAQSSQGGAGGTSSGSSSGGSGQSSTGTAGDTLGDPRLEGGGICDASIAGTRRVDPPAWLLLGLVPWLRRRARQASKR
jgi:hypothetical protein